MKQKIRFRMRYSQDMFGGDKFRIAPEDFCHYPGFTLVAGGYWDA